MGMFDNEPPKVMSIGQLAQSGAEGLGRGFNKAMGFGSKKDAVMDIMKNTDYKNAESMMEGFKGIMSIDPSAAQEYRTQIMPMIKELQSLEKGQIDITTKLQLPKLTSLWNFGGVGRNWRQGYAIKYLKMTREQAAKLNTESDLLNALKNYHKDDTKSTDYNANIKRFDRASKLAKENYLSNAAIPGYAQDSESKLDLQRTGSADASTTDVVDPNAASSRSKVLGKSTRAGNMNTAGITQIDPNASALGETYQKSEVASDVLTRVHKVRYSLDSIRDKTHTFEKNMPKDMLIRENKIDYIDDWLGRRDFIGSGSGGGEGFEHFMNYPKDLELFEKNPILWFFSKGPGKGMKDKQFSEHSYFGN